MSARALRGVAFSPQCVIPPLRLTGESKAAILTSDDWPIARQAGGETPELGLGGRWRRGIRGRGLALHLRGVGGTPHRSHAAHSHSRSRRRPRVVRIYFRARKATV